MSNPGRFPRAMRLEHDARAPAWGHDAKLVAAFVQTIAHGSPGKSCAK